MEVLVFDIIADFAYFKSPEGTRSNYSFPFPPRTALIGLLAAITGQQRNKYWSNSSFSGMKLGIQLLTKPSTYGIKMNFWRSKTTATIGGRNLDLKFIFGGSDIKDRGFTTQVKFEYLIDVRYRIYLLMHNDLCNEIAERLSAHKYHYPPYLGHANLLAEVEVVGIFPAKHVQDGQYISIIPTSAIVENTPFHEAMTKGGFQIYSSVPTSYTVEIFEVTEGIENYVSVPEKYENILVPNLDQTFQLQLVDNFGYHIDMNGSSVDICLF